MKYTIYYFDKDENCKCFNYVTYPKSWDREKIVDDFIHNSYPNSNVDSDKRITLKKGWQ